MLHVLHVMQQVLTCPADKEKVGTSCLAPCSSSQYRNGDNVCTDCDASCLTCNAAGCLTCPADKVKQGNTCISLCHSSCETCNGPTANDCITCKTGKEKYGELCVDVCLGTQFRNAAGVCTNCDSSCATCNGESANSCLTCLATKYKDGNSCVNSCPSQKYANQGVCESCDANCKDCVDSNTKCTSCNPTFYLKEDNTCSSCDSTCVNCLGSSTTCTSCEVGKFLEDGKCKVCYERCSACSSSTVCTGCKSGFNLVANECLVNYAKSTDVISAKISGGFKFINILFKYDIKDKDSEDCSFYFSAGAEKFGTGSKCKASNRNLRVDLGTEFSITPADMLTFSTTLLLVKSGDANAPGEISVEYTSNPSIKAIIKGQRNAIIGCGQTSAKLSFNGITSYSSYKITEYAWSLTGLTSSLSGTNVDFEVELSQAGTYSVSLKVTDNAQNTDTETFSLTVDVDNKIQFSFDVGDKSSFLRSTNIKITPIFSSICSCNDGLDYLYSSTKDISKLTLNNQVLRIPAKSLAPDTYPITLTVSCKGAQTFQSQNDISITLTKSDLVAITDKSDQIVTDQKDFTIRAKDSYDPDGDSFSYKWEINGVVQSAETSNSLTLLASYLTNAASPLLVTLKLQGTFSRTASKSHLLSIQKSNVLSISVLGPDKKVSVSRPLALKSKASYAPSVVSPSPITYSWSSNPSGLTSSLANFVIAASSLSPGIFYSFTITASNKDLDSVSALITFSTNSGAKCDSVGVLTPSSDITTSTLLSFKVNNCYDQDNEDYPLSYKYSIGRSGSYSLLLSVLATNTLPARRYPKVVNSLKADICDGYGDCDTVTSTFTITSRARHLKEEDANLEDYENNKIYYDTQTAIIFTLMEKVTDEALLDLMWNDLIEFESQEFLTRTYFEQLATIVLMFIDQPQVESMAAPRIPKYISYLNSRLSMMKSIYQSTASVISLIAERLPIVDNSEETSILALMLMTSTEKLNQVPGTQFTQSTAQIIVMQAVDLQTDLTPIALGSNQVILKDSGLEENAVIRIIAGSYSSASAYSDIIQLSVSSSSYFVDDSLEDYETVQEMDAKDKGCIIIMKYSGLNQDQIGCSSYQGEWVEENCKVLSVSENSAKISVTKSGIYKIVKSGSASESHIYPNLYLVISLVILCALAMPFMIYVDKNTLYMNIPSQSATSRSGLEGKFGPEYGNDYSNDSIFTKHLLISMFISAHDMPRSEKLLIIVSNIVLGILIQSLTLNSLNIHPAAVGVISALIVLPISLITIALLRYKTSKVAKIIGIALVAIIMSLSIIGVYMLSTDRLWYIAFICGLLSEFVATQSIAMGIRQFFNY